MTGREKPQGATLKNSMSFLKKLILEDPETAEIMKIASVKAAEKGLDYVEITVKGRLHSYVHKIKTEEI